MDDNFKLWAKQDRPFLSLVELVRLFCHRSEWGNRNGGHRCPSTCHLFPVQPSPQAMMNWNLGKTDMHSFFLRAWGAAVVTESFPKAMEHGNSKGSWNCICFKRVVDDYMSCTQYCCCKPLFQYIFFPNTMASMSKHNRQREQVTSSCKGQVRAPHAHTVQAEARVRAPMPSHSEVKTRPAF